MGVFNIFGRGVGTSVRKARLVLILWLANILFALLIVAPFAFLVGKGINRSLMGDKLAQGFDFLWLGDFILKNRDFLSILAGWALVPAIAYFLLSVFISGGVLGRVAAENERTTFAEFLADGSRYFFRFLRVFLISLVGYGLILGLAFRGIGSLFDLWTKNAATQWTNVWASNLRLLVFLLLFSLVRMFFDYVKVRLVVEGSRKTVRATVLTFGFILRRFFRAWGLWLLVGVLSLFVTFGFLIKTKLLVGGAGMILLFLWQQIFVAIRQWIRILFASTEVRFFKENIL